MQREPRVEARRRNASFQHFYIITVLQMLVPSPELGLCLLDERGTFPENTA